MSHKAIVGVLVALAAIAGTAFLVHKLTKAHHEKKPTVTAPVYDAWVHWKNKNGKSYGAEQESKRLTIFAANYEKIRAHMSKSDRTYDMGFTKFMDLTTQEFKALYLATHVPKRSGNVQMLNDEALPASVDWRTKDVLTPIKDQGQCGSCWAFSTTGALEALSAIGGKGKQSFSEQQLVDCSQSYGNYGCNGGLMDNGFGYVHDKGITTEAAYPYRAVDQSCKKDGGDFKIAGFTDVAAGNADQLAAAVVQQPISVAVDAENWQFYSGGVFSDCSANLDHGVLLVGYTSDAWIVKNSWGAGWGESGFIRVKRGNTCGIANAASYPHF